MNINQKTLIADLRAESLSYSEIAKRLGISKNTVKSFCKRSGLGGIAKTKKFCMNCKKSFEFNPKTKPKKFCSDKCRWDWWNSHLNEVNRKAYHSSICRFCEKQFESYGKQIRFYCSRVCYSKSRCKVAME